MITLLSDFGSQDIYIGVMKGVIASIDPQLPVVDLTHQVPPQDIAAGQFALMNAVPYFPQGTVHVAVVDPGVGSQRRGVAIEFAEGFLVGPDNGLFSGVLATSGAIAAVELTNSQYWRSPAPSATFHGRDIFAPVGAHLARGVSLHELGDPIDPKQLAQLSFPVCQITATGAQGCVQYIDRFGNLITNIPATAVEGKTWSVQVKQFQIASGTTYSDRAPGELVTLIGSHGWVELAVNQGSAQSQLQLNLGDAINVVW